MTFRQGLVLASVALAVAGLAAFSGIFNSFENPNITCGSSYIDGGVDPSDDAGFLDGGYTINAITSPGSGFYSFKIENNSAQDVFLGGPTVQPEDHVLCISNDTTTCGSTQFPVDAKSGALYCTATAATQLRAIAGGG